MHLPAFMHVAKWQPAQVHWSVASSPYLHASYSYTAVFGVALHILHILARNE